MSTIQVTLQAPVKPFPAKEMVAADLNNVFDAIATATEDIDETNIRSEGIDIRQLTDTSPIISTPKYRCNEWWDGTTNTFTLGTGLGGDLKDNMPSGKPAVYMSYGLGSGESRIRYSDTTPLTLAQGDLLRLHYSFTLYSYKSDGIVASQPITTNDTSNFLIFFPTYWDTANSTPNNISNAKIFPGRVDFFSYGVSIPASIPQTDPPSAAVSSSERLLDDGICLYDLASEEITVNVEGKPIRRIHGCLNYIHEDASPLTIYTLGICSTGVMRLTHLSGGGFDTRCFAQGTADLTPTYPFKIEMERANIGAIVMKKGGR